MSSSLVFSPDSPEISPENLCACPECGLLQQRVRLSKDQLAQCSRCEATLYSAPVETLNLSIAFATSALIVFVVASLFPVLGLDIKGRHAEATLLESALQLRIHGMNAIAGLVLFTTVIVPAMELLGLLYVLLPLKLGRFLPGQIVIYKLIHKLEPWGMIEVFLLGVLVALVKLSHMATIMPGWSLWLLGSFVFLMAATTSSLHPEDIWQRLNATAPKQIDPIGELPLARCHDCGWLNVASDRSHNCGRCGSALHIRKPNSIPRTWALLISAAILYVPANMLPVMYTSSLGHTQADTILSGVVYLWASGSWPLALVVFFASIMVPMLKLASLILLLISVKLHSRWRPVDRTRLYRLTESVGRWSMVDIFVVTMLVALVNSSPLATVEAGPGAIAFGAVVVLTMLAAEAFDPRLIWDVIEGNNHG